MKQSQQTITERHNGIVARLQAQPLLSLSVNELAELFNVSTMTIRRDLTILESMGKIIRTHGGATLLEKPSSEGNTYNLHIEAIKEKLAQVASKFVKDGMTVFINSSSTALLSLHYFNEKKLMILTNNAHVINLPYQPNWSVVLSGGEVRFPKEALVGDLALHAINQTHADVTIIGCSGLSLERGLTTINFHESAVNAAMIQNTSHKVIVVADYRKIGHNANFSMANFEKIDILITDTHADNKILHQIEKMGVQIIQVPI